MRDPEASKAVGFTVHAGINNCVYGDSCQGQRDEVSNLTRAMTNDLFHVDFHSVTANTKTFEAFVQEVRVCALVLSLSPIQRLAACLQPHLLHLLAVQKLESGNPVVFVLTAPHPWIDKQVL
jgi:hypothetical protein